MSIPLTQSEKTIVDQAIAIIDSKFNTGAFITSPADAAEYLRLRLATLQHEVFFMIWMSTTHQVIACEEIFRGTIDSAAVYPREVVKDALKHNAAACIAAHNHPSGNPEPSTADVHITRRLRDALSAVDVRLLDHLVVSTGGWASLEERGLL